MKDEMWIAPENQLILNVMISPLGIISLLATHPSIIKRTSTDPSTTVASSWEYSCITFSILCSETSYLFAFGIEHFGELCGIANTL